MSKLSFVRRAVLPGILALSLTGATAAVEGAQAMPVAAAMSHQSVPDLVDARYMHRRHYRHAGVYNCGPGSLHTHLSRKACGVTGPSRQFLRRR